MAEAQERHYSGGMTLNVRPRSWLDAGKVTSPYSSVNPASAYGQTVSYLASPPYAAANRNIGSGEVLPDPVTNGPFVGARNPFDPVDYRAPDFLLR
jgi:hypothetical protein